MEKLPVSIENQFKSIEIVCEIAKTPQEIANGLMGRKELSEDSGMIFIFSELTHNGFWMLNTFIPLSIAFFDRSGKILDIQDMQPLTIDSHTPPLPYIGALEMNQGWFVKNEIQKGDIIKINTQDI